MMSNTYFQLSNKLSSRSRLSVCQGNERQFYSCCLLGLMVAQWSVLSPPSNKVKVALHTESFLCGICMFFLCLPEVRWQSKLENLKSKCEWLFVSMWS